MIKIERLRFRYIWSMMTRSIHECWHLRTNKCVRTNTCKKSVFVVSVRNINICGRILTQFTGLLRTNTVAAKRDLLAERTGLGKSVLVSLRKNRPKATLKSKNRYSFSVRLKVCSSLVLTFEVKIWFWLFFLLSDVSKTKLAYSNFTKLVSLSY